MAIATFDLKLSTQKLHFFFFFWNHLGMIRNLVCTLYTYSVKTMFNLSVHLLYTINIQHCTFSSLLVQRFS